MDKNKVSDFCFAQLQQEVDVEKNKVKQKFYHDDCSNAFRGFYAQAEGATEKYLDAKKAVASLFELDYSDEILFLPGSELSAMGLLAAWAKRLSGKNDRVVVFSDSSAVGAFWQVAALEGSFDLEVSLSRYCCDIESSLKRGDLKLLILPIFSKDCGALWQDDFTDLRGIISLAKSLGAKVVLSFEDFLSCPQVARPGLLGADGFLCCSKDFFLDAGTQVCWFSSNFANELSPCFFGGGSIESVEKQGFSLLPGYKKFESGSPDLGQALAIAVATKKIKKRVF